MDFLSEQETGATFKTMGRNAGWCRLDMRETLSLLNTVQEAAPGCTISLCVDANQDKIFNNTEFPVEIECSTQKKQHIRQKPYPKQGFKKTTAFFSVPSPCFGTCGLSPWRSWPHWCWWCWPHITWYTSTGPVVGGPNSANVLLVKIGVGRFGIPSTINYLLGVKQPPLFINHWEFGTWAKYLWLMYFWSNMTIILLV